MMDRLGAIYSLSLRLLLRSRKTIFMALLGLLPVAGSALAAAVIRFRLGEGASTAFGAAADVMSLLLLGLPVAVTLFYATALIGDEIEDKTLTYLFVRPVPRGVVYAGKYLAASTAGGILVIPSAILSFLVLISADPSSEAPAHLVVLAKDVGILLLGLLAYAGLFGFFGAVLKRPLLAGILFALGWESIATYIPGYIHRFTVMHYLQSLLPHASGQRGVLAIFQQTTSAPVSILTLILIAGGFLALSCWAVSRREYVLEA